MPIKRRISPLPQSKLDSPYRHKLNLPPIRSDANLVQNKLGTTQAWRKSNSTQLVGSLYMVLVFVLRQNFVCRGLYGKPRFTPTNTNVQT